MTTVVASDDEPPRIDYLTLARGALPIGVGGDTAARGVVIDSALSAIDGNPAKYPLANKMFSADLTTELTYRLPAATTFDRFAVPGVVETPSPSQTFTRDVEVLGSAVSESGGFVTLAKGRLAVHAEKGGVTELAVEATVPVRWIRVRLKGGIDDGKPEFFQDFSEIIGNGTQESVPLVTGFRGIWKHRALTLELEQDGTLVRGCYDAAGVLHGSVTGNVLHATGSDEKTGVSSMFVMLLDAEGGIRGVRSSNGAPFHAYNLPVAPAGTKAVCAKKPSPTLGCGAVVHGIQFDFDSASIRPESETTLAALYEGLRSEASTAIVIEGHTSSEGSAAYNRDLSQRRAQAVADALAKRGIEPERVRAVGKGETEPLAPNDDEAGRTINRRVEIDCTGT